MGGTLQPERGVSGPRASVRSARGEGRGLARCVLVVPAAGVPGGGGGIQVSAGTVDYANMERFLVLLGGDVGGPTLRP